MGLGLRLGLRSVSGFGVGLGFKVKQVLTVLSKLGEGLCSRRRSRQHASSDPNLAVALSITLPIVFPR